MSIYEITPTTTTFLADHMQRWGYHEFHPWFLIARLVFLILVIIAIAVAVRYWRGRQGERTLRDTYAKGEITEDEYRARLAVLRETRH